MKGIFFAAAACLLSVTSTLAAPKPDAAPAAPAALEPNALDASYEKRAYEIEDLDKRHDGDNHWYPYTDDYWKKLYEYYKHHYGDQYDNWHHLKDWYDRDNDGHNDEHWYKRLWHNYKQKYGQDHKYKDYHDYKSHYDDDYKKHKYHQKDWHD